MAGFRRLLQHRSLTHSRTIAPATAHENLSAVLLRKGDLRVQPSAPPPAPSPNEVRVSMRSVGICGSDIHYWVHGRIGSYIVESPMVLGHEGAGEVVAVGDDVRTLAVGDRVALEPGVPCGECRECRTGRYNLCTDVRFSATPPVDGCLAREVNHPAGFCFKLPDVVSYDQAALLEPLSVAVHACRRGEVRLGCSVFITGAGPIGLMCVVAARAAGATRVVISDVDPKRLALAKSAGAHDAFLAGELPSERLDADVCFEASGAEPALAACIHHAHPGGVVVAVGMGAPTMNVPLLEAACREVDIRGVFRYCNTYQDALDMVASGAIDPSFMVTHRFPLEGAVEGFETARDSGRTEAVKVMIDCGDS